MIRILFGKPDRVAHKPSFRVSLEMAFIGRLGVILLSYLLARKAQRRKLERQSWEGNPSSAAQSQRPYGRTVHLVVVFALTRQLVEDHMVVGVADAAYAV